MTFSECAEMTGQGPLVGFWIGTLLLAVVIRRAHGLSVSQTLRVMLGRSVPGVALYGWVFWAGLGLVSVVMGTWVVLIRGCPGA